MIKVQKGEKRVSCRFKYIQWNCFPNHCLLLDPSLCWDQKNFPIAYLGSVLSNSDSYWTVLERLKRELHTYKGPISCIILINAESKKEFPISFFPGNQVSIPCLLISHSDGNKVSQMFLSQKPQASNQSLLSRAGNLVGGIVNYFTRKEKRAQFVREFTWQASDAKQMFNLLNEQIFKVWDSTVSVLIFFLVTAQSDKTLVTFLKHSCMLYNLK